LPLIRRIATPYGPVSVLRDGQTGEWVYKQGGARQSESDGLGVSTSAYIHAMFGLIVQKPAAHVLCIGGAAGSLASMLAMRVPKVTMVDINAQAFDIARDYFSLSPKVICETADGAAILKERPQVYDAIALDAFEGSEIPAQFLTPRFARLARSRLHPKRGRLIVNVFVPWFDHPIANQVSTTLATAFRRVRMLDEPGLTHRNCIVAAGDVASLVKPKLVLAPACEAAKVRDDLAAYRFLDGPAD
jgi:spermidine synthase